MVESVAERETRWETDRIARQAAHEEKKAELATLVASGKFEWHCEGQHGVARGLHRSTGEMSKVVELLNYFGFRGHIWRSGRDIEFVKSGSKPWRWCGATVLFADWKAGEDEQEAARLLFRIGDKVRFTYHSRTYTGIIANMNKRATVVVPGETSRWYIAATNLTKVA